MKIKNRVNEIYIHKYIKHMFGLDVKIKIVHHFWGRFGAMAWRGDKNHCHLIKITESLVKDSECLSYMLWHEVGHLFTASVKNRGYKNEVNAQIWAMKNMKKRGYNKLYKKSINYVKDWIIGVECAEKNMYKKAGKIILKKLKI